MLIIFVDINHIHDMQQTAIVMETRQQVVR